MAQLSREDLALYDRQIRLWGLAAQESTVIVAGIFSGVAQELIKNLTLKGIARILLASYGGSQQQQTLSPSGMLFANVMEGAVTNVELAQRTMAQASLLNPTVELEHLHYGSVSEIPLEGAAICILVNESSPQTVFALDSRCRQYGTAFEWVLTAAFNALLINDFGPAHRYIVETKRTAPEGNTVTEASTKEMRFPDLESLWKQHHAGEATGAAPRRISRARPAAWSPTFAHIQRALDSGQHEGSPLEKFLCELAPVNALIGAVAAQEAIKAVTGRDMPLDNIMLFDGHTLDSTIISVDIPQ